MRHACLSFSLCALCGLQSIHAEETQVNDLRLILGTTLTDGTDFETQSTGTKLDTKLEEGFRAGLRYVRSVDTLKERGGLVWGVGVFFNGQEGDIANSSTRITMDVTALEGMIAFALPIEEAPLHFEIGLVASVGTAEVKFETAGSSKSDTGGYWDVGLEVGAYYTVSHHWVLGVDFRYLFNGETTYHNNATTVNVFVKNHLEIGAAMGYRF